MRSIRDYILHSIKKVLSGIGSKSEIVELSKEGRREGIILVIKIIGVNELTKH